MGNPATAGGGGPRAIPPAGLTPARCVQVIELGTQKENFKGVDKLIFKIRLAFETPELMHVFEEDKGEQPFMLSQTFTKSISDKANFRKFIESWLGRSLTKEEIEKGFDPSQLLNKAGMINIIHRAAKSDASKIYANIASISPMPKSTPTKKVTMVKAINPLIDFFFGAENQWIEFEKIYPFLQKIIMESPEYQEQKVRTGYKGPAIAETASVQAEEPEEDQF